MRYGSVKHIALYYKAIPGMLRLLRQERAELEGNYKAASRRRWRTSRHGKESWGETSTRRS